MNWLDARKRIYYIISFILVLLFIVLIYSQAPKFRLVSPRLPTELSQVPYYAWCSFYRMLIAYALALAFALSYGYVAATNPRAEKLMLPALDIFQSIPVLGLFPAAIYFFIQFLHGRIGVELAIISLIFTSQAWNMAFGVYESLTTLPEDSKEAVTSYGVRGWLKFREFLFPACIPKLVYNSIMSWAGGWYALTACEILTLGRDKYKLPGLGSFLATAAETGKVELVLVGLGALITIIVCMDIFLWRPLSVWAEKFRYELAVSTTSPEGSRVLDWIRDQTLLTRWARRVGRPIDAIFDRLSHFLILDSQKSVAAKARLLTWIKRLALWLFILMVAYGSWRATRTLIYTLRKPWPDQAVLIPAAILASGLRMSVAYVLALAWTLPLAIWVGQRERLAKIATPLAEIGVSIPAPAFYPLLVPLIPYTTMNVPATLIILTGMQGYLLFNLIAGVRNIPGDLKEVVQSFGLGKLNRWRQLIIPAIVPSLITGSITAWGGGWNAIIFSEYMEYKEVTHSVLGIGALLDEAVYKTGDTTMILLSLLSMVTVIVLINRLFWRRLYFQAMAKYKIEY
ncbi:MAG: ABC transporter permease subunit [Acidobacteria bacterium]|nr:ABC transporter permease subunit [Acidobacteriota bacterium]MBI3655153.1 ABC transporter permease subunit [Acidobacteriota bacterium]